MVAQANFRGTWQVSGAQLFIEFPLTMASGPAQTQIAMEFTRVSANSLSGVDRFLRPWEWQRVEQQSEAPRTGLNSMDQAEKQELLGKMLQNLANMRHEMLKAVVDKLPDEESPEETPLPKSPRRRRNPGK